MRLCQKHGSWVHGWVVLILLLPVLARADMKVLAQETFEEYDTTAVHNGRAMVWSSDVKGGIEVVDGFGLVRGKAFRGNKVVGILPFMVLANPGDTVKVHFSFRLPGPIAGTPGGFKMGLFEGGDPANPWFATPGNGYRWNIGTGSNAVPVTLAKESGGAGQKVLSGQDTTFIDQSKGSFQVNDTVRHSSSDPLTVSLAPTGFAIRSDANIFLFDDFTVEGNMNSNANLD